MATLYRYYDYLGELLYVGQTSIGRGRGSGHARDSGWWYLVTFAEFHEVHPDDIDLAERLAVWVERPLYNRALRVTTKQRQAMLARLDERWPYTHEMPIDVVAEVAGLSEHAIESAVRWGFLACSYPRRRTFTVEQVRAFIGTDDPGPATLQRPTPEGDLRPRIAVLLARLDKEDA